jgi:hypothetical protein
MADDCAGNFDSLKLVREGTSQDGRFAPALDPASAPADGRSVADGIVFANGYARLLKLFDGTDAAVSDWGGLFGGDPSVPLAVAATEDVDAYRAAVNAWLDYLNDTANAARTARLRDRLGYLYAAVGTLARAIDDLKETLPADIALKHTLRGLIGGQLAPMLERLIAYHGGGVAAGLVNDVAPAPVVRALGRDITPFSGTLAAGLSPDWSGGADWTAYVAGIAPDGTVYGPPGTIFNRINHCTTHTLFRAILDRFLRALSRIVAEAGKELDRTLTGWNGHAPHFAAFLAFLRLRDYTRASGNRLTGHHLDFYYRTILGLAEKPAAPGRVHLLAELARSSETHAFEAGELFRAGKDAGGKDVVFAATEERVANQARVAALTTLYRNAEAVGGSGADIGRIFASPVANSGDGIGGQIVADDPSWHPFFNKRHVEGKLAAIDMPEAEIGFAIASHCLLMAEGRRVIWLTLTIENGTGVDFTPDVACLLTTGKGWVEAPVTYFGPWFAPGKYLFFAELSGADPAITPYAPGVHGYAFRTTQPMMLVRLKHDPARPYGYAAMQGLTLARIDLHVAVDAVRALAVSNDFGAIDTSKPFLPFGPDPAASGALVIGSKEVFQKKLTHATVDIAWRVAPTVYGKDAAQPSVKVEFLSAGAWASTAIPAVTIPADGAGATTSVELSSDLEKPALDAPDYAATAAYGTGARRGFLRLRLSGDLGQAAYQAALLTWLAGKGDKPSPQPVAPVAEGVAMSYVATTPIMLDTGRASAFEARSGQFFHLAPFGVAERHPHLSEGVPVSLVPQFGFVRDGVALASEAEFCIGVAGLKPPQNLALLFQAVDGTANPLAEKPRPHIDWSYLAGDRWIPFEAAAVRDGTDELLGAGIVTLAVPREASSDSSLMPAGMHWIRAAVHERSDAVCRLRLVAAQALEAVFVDRGNDPGFSASPLPAGTISKLATPVAAVKSLAQPFPSFGGRGAEEPRDFYARVSEQLRHKDRAITLWDHERLILEAFPQVYKVKCLNHTRFEPSESGAGVYRELAAGHVTLVMVPRLQGQTFRDPLRPFASLGLLQEIEAFLRRRTSCFARLHVRNPQFEEVRLVFAARLRDGFDESHSVRQLQQAITRFLSPWAFGGGSPSFGGKIYKSVLIDFVEDQPSVDYVTDFRMFRDVAGVEGSTDLDEAEGSLAVSILVSAPASRHAITVLHPAADALAAEDCGCRA